MGLIPPGILTQTLTVERATRTPNGAGGWTETWTAVGTCRGRTAALRSKLFERVVAEQPVDAQLVEIYADLTTVAVDGSERIVLPDGTTYEIIALQFQDALAFIAGRKV